MDAGPRPEACLASPAPDLGRRRPREAVVEVLEGFAHREGAADGGLCMIIDIVRRIEYRQDRVAEDLDDAALVSVDDLVHDPEIGVEQRHHLLRRGELGHRRIALDVREDDRDVALLAA